MKKRINDGKRRELEVNAIEALNALVQEDGDLIECFNALIFVALQQSEFICTNLEDEDPAQAAIQQTQYDELVRALRKLRNDTNMKGL